MTRNLRATAVIAGAALLLAAAAVAQTLKAPTAPANIQAAAASQIDLIALRNDISALKKENETLRSEIALVKTQAGNAVAVNVNQSQILNPLVSRLDDLEHRYNRHTHLFRFNQFDGVTKSIARIKTGEPSDLCTMDGTNNFSCTVPPKP